MKKLIGSNDIEDALKRLDRLTQEEARMVSAQQLKISNAIDSGVRGVADNVLVIVDDIDQVKRSWSQPHSYRICRLNHPHRESITT